ncbi:MAG: hypothetical protein HKO64_10430, partial [Xanthomonadales bacterium]|nr:hypothetical protein [Xanthomonadales bacterium]
IRKSNRAEAVSKLLEWANRQAMWRADNPSYNLGVTPLADTYYVYSMTATASTYTLTATAQGSQASDKEDGISCSVITLNQVGATGPSGHEVCWSH